MTIKRNVVLFAAAATALLICSVLFSHAEWAMAAGAASLKVMAIPVAMANTDGSLKALLERRADFVGQMGAILNTAEAEDRDLTAEEIAKYDGLKADKEALDKRIGRLEDVGASQHALAQPRPAAGARSGIVRPGGPEASREFESFGQFMHSVRFNPNDQRLSFIEGVGTGEDMSAANDMRMDTGATGGFMIPPQFRADMFQKVNPQDSLVRPRATVIPAGDPPDAAITFPALDQSGSNPGNMYGGVQVQWISEGALKPQTDAALTDITLEPHEIAGHVVVTDKLLRNWQAADAMLKGLLRGAVLGAEDYAFLRANGVGKPMGIISSPATYRINRAVANQIKYLDLVNMVARLLMRGGNPVWSAPQSALVQLATLQDPNGNYIWKANDSATTNAAQGFAGTLLGYPLRWNNRAPALGSYGDIVLADWSYYLIKDGSGPFVAASEHVYFLNNKTVIKIFWNVDGSPWLNAPFTEENGYQVSPFVALDIPGS